MPINQKFSRRSVSTSAVLLAATIAGNQFGQPMSAKQSTRSDSTPPTSTPFEEVLGWLTTRASELEVPGGAIGVVHGNEEFHAGFGIANVVTGTNFMPDTSFEIASLSKIFTASVLAQLLDEGKIALDDPIKSILPDFSLADLEATEMVTIRHLLAHSGGWEDPMEIEAGQESLEGFPAGMQDLTQVAPPGSHFSYSNSGYIVAGSVIEKVVGKPFPEVVSERVLYPLGMNDSSYSADATDTEKHAVGHDSDGDQLIVVEASEYPASADPSAGVISTIDDMLKFVKAHAGIDSTSLDSSVVASMAQPLGTGGSVGPIVVENVAYGWMVFNVDGETVLMSQGGDAGRMSTMIAVPSRKFGMAYFANSESALLLGQELVTECLSKFLELSPAESEPYTLTPDEADTAIGRFGLADWMTFEIKPGDSTLVLDTSAGGESIPDLSGELTLVSPTSGFLSHPGGNVWIDLVPDETGRVQWLRFAGRLVPRINS